MKRLVSRRTAVLLALGVLPTITAAPASANWFSADPDTGLRRHIGSAPNPTPADIRANRAERTTDQANGSGSRVRTTDVTPEKSR